MRHLFTVAASLDSMVVGEPQILAQVKQAYQLASERDSTGPLTHPVFQAALRVAKRVASETSIHEQRVSIPSVAVADFARQIFERFDDKHVLVIGAGEMAEETLRYLQDEGAGDVTVVNRRRERAAELAADWRRPGRAPGTSSTRLLVGRRPGGQHHRRQRADRHARATSARSKPRRYQRPLFILDLAVPRDFEPGHRRPPGRVPVLDRRPAARPASGTGSERDKELPAALPIIEEETARFMADLYHRATGPIIQRLRQGWQKPKEDELRRLLNKLPDLDERATGRNPAVVRPAGEQALAPAAGIAARRSAARHPARAVGCAEAVVPVEGLRGDLRKESWMCCQFAWRLSVFSTNGQPDGKRLTVLVQRELIFVDIA